MEWKPIINSCDVFSTSVHLYWISSRFRPWAMFSHRATDFFSNRVISFSLLYPNTTFPAATVHNVDRRRRGAPDLPAPPRQAGPGVPPPAGGAGAGSAPAYLNTTFPAATVHNVDLPGTTKTCPGSYSIVVPKVVVVLPPSQGLRRDMDERQPGPSAALTLGL